MRYWDEQIKELGEYEYIHYKKAETQIFATPNDTGSYQLLYTMIDPLDLNVT